MVLHRHCVPQGATALERRDLPGRTDAPLPSAVASLASLAQATAFLVSIYTPMLARYELARAEAFKRWGLRVFTVNHKRGDGSRVFFEVRLDSWLGERHLIIWERDVVRVQE